MTGTTSATSKTSKKAAVTMTADQKLVHNERIKFLAAMSERIGTGILLVGGLGSMLKLGYDTVVAHAARTEVAQPDVYFAITFSACISAAIFYAIGYQELRKLKT
jgi:hypothetical protein